MDFKTIKTDPKYPDVLVYRDRDCVGDELVMVLAIGIINGEEDQFAVERAKFPNKSLASAFVNDFTTDSANEFCARCGINL